MGPKRTDILFRWISLQKFIFVRSYYVAIKRLVIAIRTLPRTLLLWTLNSLPGILWYHFKNSFVYARWLLWFTVTAGSSIYRDWCTLWGFIRDRIPVKFKSPLSVGFFTLTVLVITGYLVRVVGYVLGVGEGYALPLVWTLNALLSLGFLEVLACLYRLEKRGLARKKLTHQQSFWQFLREEAWAPHFGVYRALLITVWSFLRISFFVLYGLSIYALLIFVLVSSLIALWFGVILFVLWRYSYLDSFYTFVWDTWAFFTTGSNWFLILVFFGKWALYFFYCTGSLGSFYTF